MRGVAYWAMVSGLIVILLMTASPWILEWQLKQSLVRFGAEHLAASEAQQMIQERAWQLSFGFLLGLASFIAGVLLFNRRKSGWYVWFATCCAFVVIQAVELSQNARLFVPAFWGLWWLATAIVSIVIYRRSRMLAHEQGA